MVTEEWVAEAEYWSGAAKYLGCNAYELSLLEEAWRWGDSEAAETVASRYGAFRIVTVHQLLDETLARLARVVGDW
jgi:hypothetical protein